MGTKNLKFHRMYVANDPINSVDPMGMERVYQNTYPRSNLGRGEVYKKFHASLLDGEAAHPTFFYGAAARTMGWGSLGLAEASKFIPFDQLGNPMSMKSITYANHLSYNLFGRANKPLYEALYDGGALPSSLEGLSGQDLDYGIVSFEQGLVQMYLDGMPDGDRQRFISESTAGIRLSPDPVVQSVVNSYGDAFDFGNQEHREAIGRGLVDRERSEFCATNDRHTAC